MNKKDYDIIVVGCGPGGASAGNFAARNGMKVLVVEEKRDVGMPLKDGVSVLYSIAETEETAGMKIESRWIEHLLAQNAFFSPSGKCGGGQLWPDGVVILRYLFEKGLAENAIRSGAEVWIDTRMVDLVKDSTGQVCGVRVLRGGEPKELTCSVVIGADGIYGEVGRKAGLPLPRECVAGISYQLVGIYPRQPLPPTYEMHIGDRITAGYFGWVVPHSNETMSIGLGFRPDFLKGDITPRQMAQRFMKHLEEIGRYRFDKAGTVCMMAGATTTFRETGARIVTDGVMLVGDGAWRPLFRSQWGTAGMLTAIYTGRLAAEVAAQAIKDGDVSEKSLRRYPEQCQRSLAGKEDEMKEARQYFSRIIALPDDKKDKIIADIGNHVSTLHLCTKGALHLSACLGPIKEWFRKEVAA